MKGKEKCTICLIGGIELSKTKKGGVKTILFPRLTRDRMKTDRINI